MTVGELLKILQEFDPDETIETYEDEIGEMCYSIPIESVIRRKTKCYKGNVAEVKEILLIY